MLNGRVLKHLGSIALVSIAAAGVARADSMQQVTSSSSQAANDSLSWSQKGADGTVLPVSFSATTVTSNAVTVGLGAANSVTSVVCTASPCSWTGTGFTAGHTLLWTSDAANGGSGPVTLTFATHVSGAGALIQSDLPGAFTAEIQVYNGSTLLATYSVASDTAGDPVYLGARDLTGPNISKAVFSLTACPSLCTDFGLDTVNVNATATGTVTLTPTSLAFAATTVGSTSAAQAVTVKNTGAGTVTLNSETITGTNATSFIKSGTTCGSSLAAGASCTVSVEFHPAGPGPLTASLSVADSATGSPQTATLSGTGVTTGGPVVLLSPTSIAFPSIAVGSTTSAQGVTLTNTGGSALTISTLGFTGASPTSFVEVGTCTTSLASGASCSLYAAFKPGQVASVSASLAIADNAPGSPQQVTVTGTGTTMPVLGVSATSLTFPTLPHGSTSLSQAVTLSNTGTVPVVLGPIYLSGTNPTDFVEVNGCGATIAAGSSCRVYVAFKPAAVASYTGTVIIKNNATNSAQSISLSGTGN
jgi:trimeric autotransporter adhesin